MLGDVPPKSCQEENQVFGKEFRAESLASFVPPVDSGEQRLDHRQLLRK